MTAGAVPSSQGPQQVAATGPWKVFTDGLPDGASGTRHCVRKRGCQRGSSGFGACWPFMRGPGGWAHIWGAGSFRGEGGGQRLGSGSCWGSFPSEPLAADLRGRGPCSHSLGSWNRLCLHTCPSCCPLPYLRAPGPMRGGAGWGHASVSWSLCRVLLRCLLAALPRL